MTRFIFDRINGEDMTNFYNLMRIRGELPFIERDNVAISVDLTDEISFYKKQDIEIKKDLFLDNIFYCLKFLLIFNYDYFILI